MGGSRGGKALLVRVQGGQSPLVKKDSYPFVLVFYSVNNTWRLMGVSRGDFAPWLRRGVQGVICFIFFLIVMTTLRG